MAASQTKDDRKRAAVFGYRLMFSPETQPIKQTVVSQILLTQLAESDNQNGEGVGNLATLMSNGVHVLTLSFDEARYLLRRLVGEGLVEELDFRRKPRWKITDTGRHKIQRARDDAERRIDSVVENLFGERNPTKEFRAAFLETLTDIFRRLAREYVELFLGNVDEFSFFAARDIETVAQGVLSKFPNIDAEEFLLGLQTFFQEDHPDATWLKWTYCKNYYSLQIMGLGDASAELSKEVFSGTTAYLDTNVLISALDSNSRNHSAVRQTIAGLREAGCDIGVLAITVEEFRNYAEKSRVNLDAVLRQIPDGLLTKVRGIVASTEAIHRNDPNKPSPRAVLVDLVENSDNIIKDRLQATIDGDKWFNDNRDSEKIASLAEELRQHYDQTSLLRSKSPDAAKHDALALQFVNERESDGKKSMFVTLDISLPTFRYPNPPKSAGQCHTVIKVDALLPWLGMVAQDDDEVAKAYASLLSNQVTMQQTLSINEFRMLAEIGMDCGNMPAEDVEQCILYLRREVKGVDLQKAEDREKLHHRVRSFFSSPDRKYLSEISGLRGELHDTKNEFAQVRKNIEEENERTREQIADYEKLIKTGKVKLRLSLVGMLFVIGLIICLWLSNGFGAGDNMMQRIGTSWWLFGLLVTACLGLIRLSCAGELWPVAKRMLPFFRND